MRFWIFLSATEYACVEMKPCRSGGLALFFYDMKSTLLEQGGEEGYQRNSELNPDCEAC